MPKEKTRMFVEDREPFHEIIGIFIILFSLITLAGVGEIGLYIKIIFKILFGDLMAIIFLIILILGIRSIRCKVVVNVHNISFYGVILIFIGISTIMHLSIYNGLGLNNKNILSKSLDMYKYYYNNYNSNYIFGGGLIGALFLQVSAFLFGFIGSIIFSIAIIISGLALITNNTINGIYKKITLFLKKIIFYIKKFFSLFSKIKITPKTEKKVNAYLSDLRDVKPSINRNIQESIGRDYAYKINRIISTNKMYARLIGIYVGYNSTTIKIEGKDINKILEIFEKYFIINDNNIYIIEIYNSFKELLTLRKCLSIIEESNYLLPIGMNNMLDLICINIKSYNYTLIAGDLGSGIRSYIRSLVVSIIIKYQEQFHLYVLDLKEHMKEYEIYSKYINYETNLKGSLRVLDEICITIDKRKEIIKYLNLKSFNENNELIPLFLILNANIEECGSEFFTKLDYILKFGGSVGIHSVIIVRKRVDLGGITINNANRICFYTSNIDLSIGVIESDLATKLEMYGDIIYNNGTYVSHAQAPFVGDYDFKSIIKKIID